MRITLEKVHASPDSYYRGQLVWQHYVWLDNDDRKPLATIGIHCTDKALLDDKVYADTARWGKTPEERMAAEFKKLKYDKEIKAVKKLVNRKYRWQRIKLWFGCLFGGKTKELARLDRMIDYETIAELDNPLDAVTQRYFLKRQRLLKTGVPLEVLQEMTYDEFMESTICSSHLKSDRSGYVGYSIMNPHKDMVNGGYYVKTDDEEIENNIEEVEETKPDETN